MTRTLTILKPVTIFTQKINKIIGYSLAVVLISSMQTVVAQDSAKLVRTLQDNAIDFEVDNLGNIFTINEDGAIKKRSSSFDSIALYNQVRRFGALKQMDVSNPLKIVLYYADFVTVVVLDRFLNERNIIDLRQSGIYKAGAVAQSFDNNIWVWDDLESKLKKINDEGKLLLESADMRVVFDAPPQPQALVDNNRFLYAYDSLKGLLVMDYYGAYKTLLPYTGWQYVHSIGQGVAGYKNQQLEYYNPKQLLTQSVVISNILGAENAKMKLVNDRLYVLNAKGELLIYNYNIRVGN